MPGVVNQMWFLPQTNITLNNSGFMNRQLNGHGGWFEVLAMPRLPLNFAAREHKITYHLNKSVWYPAP